MSVSCQRRRKALLEGITAGLIFGTASIFIRFVPGVSVYTIAAGRLGVASVILAIVVGLFEQPSPIKIFREFKSEALLLGILLGLHFLFFTASVKNTTILNATVLVNTAPVQATMISLAFKVRPSKVAFLGMLLSFVGVLVIAFEELSLGFSVNLVGDLEALLAAFFEALYLNYGRGVRSKTSILPLMLTLYSVSTLTIVLSSFAMGAPIIKALSVRQIMFLIGLGILPTTVAHTLYFSALSGLWSFETATLALLEPVGATILGIIIFSEVPGPMFVIGAIVVLSGISLVIRR